MRWEAMVLTMASACSFQITAGQGLAEDAGVADTPADARPSVDGSVIDTIAAACNPSWTHAFGASRYYVGSNKTFDEAQAYCASQGERLAIVESAAENAALAALLTTAGADSWTWIGLADRTTEGIDVWIDGVPVGAADYTNYNGKIGPAADCYDFSKDPSGGRWGDWYCDNAHSYVCECDPNRPFP